MSALTGIQQAVKELGAEQIDTLEKNEEAAGENNRPLSNTPANRAMHGDSMFSNMKGGLT